MSCPSNNETDGKEVMPHIYIRIEEVSKVTATTTMINTVSALTTLSAKKLIVAMPFEEELNKRQ